MFRGLYLGGYCIEGRNEEDKMDGWIYGLAFEYPYHRDKSYRSLMILSSVHIRSRQLVRRKPLQYLVMMDYIRSFSN